MEARLFARISKSIVVFSKRFQRNRWPFFGISTGCNRSKPQSSVSKYFRRAPFRAPSRSLPAGAAGSSEKVNFDPSTISVIQKEKNG
jgi:hypothetical protein